jgi:hypothetical protein
MLHQSVKWPVVHQTRDRDGLERALLGCTDDRELHTFIERRAETASPEQIHHQFLVEANDLLIIHCMGEGHHLVFNRLVKIVAVLDSEHVGSIPGILRQVRQMKIVLTS